MAQATETHTTSRREILAAALAAAIASPIALATPAAAISAFTGVASSVATDPVCAAIERYRAAAALLKEAEAIHVKDESDQNEALMSERYDIAVDALDEAVETVPSSIGGIFALLELQRDLWDIDWEMVDKDHLSFICESVETALQGLGLNS